MASALVVMFVAVRIADRRKAPLFDVKFHKPEFTSAQPIEDFFAAPARPDSRAYRDYRHYLLETSQVPGGFYSARGRRALLRQVVDMMLAPEDPYEALPAGKAAPRQQLRVVN